MRLVFMGTPEFSVPVLRALVAAGHEVAAVYCQPPRPAGRGKKDRPSPVVTACSSSARKAGSPVTKVSTRPSKLAESSVRSRCSALKDGFAGCRREKSRAGLA